MQHALNLLTQQPTLWPKWEIGRDADDQPTAEKHMFIFDPSEFGQGFGRAIAACQFVGGAAWIGRLKSGQPSEVFSSIGTPACSDCMEIALQHVLQQPPE